MTIHDDLISNMPAGLDRAILRILSFHEGVENAISRSRLLNEINNQRHFVAKLDDRHLRAAINKLRKEGNLICSRGGNEGGYFVPSTPGEFNEYLERELHPRAMDLLEQERAMKAAAEGKWGAASRQMTLV